MDVPTSNDGALTHRVVDACLNRGTEALRVVEDIARFVFDDPWLTAAAKDLRHETVVAVHHIFDPVALPAMRDTQHDVGTRIQGAQEYDRASLCDVVTSNFKRAEQALRSIEECSKLVCPASAACVEQLRYRVYSLERNFASRRLALERLDGVDVCVLVDGAGDASVFRRKIDCLVRAAPVMIQLRDHGLADRDLLFRAEQLVDAARGAAVVTVINNRADMAAAAGADGVHLGQDDLPVAAARRLLGPRALIGVSAHSPEQARQAVQDGAHYLGVGPIFPSRTKQFHEWVGVALVRQINDVSTIPSFAIGGIGLDNVQQVLAGGGRRIAVQHAVWSADDPLQALQRLQAAIRQGMH